MAASSRSLAASTRSRRSRSIARLRAVVISHAAGLAGHALGRPAPRRDRERLGDGFLGELEVAQVTDDRGEDTAPLVAKDLLKGGQDALPMSGRISMVPPSRSAGMRAAISVAWSRLSASYR